MAEIRKTCGVRAHYYKHLSGLCMRAPHDDSVDHIIEMITPDLGDVDYSAYHGKGKPMTMKMTKMTLPVDPAKQGMTPITFDLWLDGTDMDDSASWRAELMVDFDQFESDPHFAAVISDYIQRKLEHLAREVEEIALQYGPSDICLGES